MIKCRECYFTLSEEDIKKYTKAALIKKLIDHRQEHLVTPRDEDIIKKYFERITPGKSEGSPCIL